MDCCFDFSRKNMSSRKMENDKYAEASITKAIMAIVVPARTNIRRGRIAFYSILKATREFDERTLLGYVCNWGVLQYPRLTRTGIRFCGHVSFCTAYVRFWPIGDMGMRSIFVGCASGYLFAIICVG